MEEIVIGDYKTYRPGSRIRLIIELRYCKSTWRELKVETKEGEASEFIIHLSE